MNYFHKYKKITVAMNSKHYQRKNYKSFDRKVHNRLYNENTQRKIRLDNLAQKYLENESKKYTYFPEINNYDLIFKKYYIINTFTNSESNISNNDYNTDSMTNPIVENSVSIKTPQRIKNFSNISESVSVNENKKINIFIPNLIKLNNNQNNITTESQYHNYIIKNKLSLLSELEKQKSKIYTKKISKIRHKKGFNKNSRNETEANSIKSYDWHENINNKKVKNINQKQNISEINLENLRSYYPSPTVQKEFNNSKSSPHNNIEINNEQLKNNNSYIVQSAKTNAIKNYILTPNNNNDNLFYPKFISANSVSPDSPDSHDQNQIFFNSYKFLPKNECSLFLEATKYKTYKTNTNYNSISNKKNTLFKNNHDTVPNNIKNIYSNKHKQFNSIRLIDNSLSTNFLDRPSSNDNYTLSINDNNHQQSFNNVSNKNFSYLFPSKENNIYLKSTNENNKNTERKIYYKNISFNSHRKNNKKNSQETFNGIKTDRNEDVDNCIYKKVMNITNSTGQKQKINNTGNNKEKIDDFNINDALKDKKMENLDNLEIRSKIVNEKVANKRNKYEKKTFREQDNDSIAMQSVSDSKIFEIANYYLNEEETVDKIAIDDILLTKNNKNNCNLKEKNSIDL